MWEEEMDYIIHLSEGLIIQDVDGRNGLYYYTSIRGLIIQGVDDIDYTT